MGLDNYPLRYPCKTNKTAVLVDGKIDCVATIDQNGCPYTTALDESNPEWDDDDIIPGSTGVPCWYRGKVGNYLLETLGAKTNDLNFYGDNRDGSRKSASSCHNVADVMEKRLSDLGGTLLDGDGDATGAVKYAIWWLRWVADNGGSATWY